MLPVYEAIPLDPFRNRAEALHAIAYPRGKPIFEYWMWLK
jgi:hypothetical protein